MFQGVLASSMEDAMTRIVPHHSSQGHRTAAQPEMAHKGVHASGQDKEAAGLLHSVEKLPEVALHHAHCLIMSMPCVCKKLIQAMDQTSN